MDRADKPRRSANNDISSCANWDAAEECAAGFASAQAEDREVRATSGRGAAHRCQLSFGCASFEVVRPQYHPSIRTSACDVHGPLARTCHVLNEAGSVGAVNTDGGIETRVPRAMSTQHPDNVATPIFSRDSLMSAEDEVREAFYAFAHLGCDEQMWDFEGKEVDNFVVQKLLASNEQYFRANPLGDRLRLTPRVPNPRFERVQAKGLLEVLHSLPRHADAARLFFGASRPPIIELIFPMTTSALELERIRTYYLRNVVEAAKAPLVPGDISVSTWCGAFEPADIGVIPLIEDLPYLLEPEAIVADYVSGKDLPYQRVFIARSDPALNYGLIAAVLASLVA